MSLASKVFPALTVDGATAVYIVAGGVAARATKMLAGCSGSLGGGALSLQYSPDGGTTWLALPANAIVIATGVSFELPPGTPVRFNLTGSTAPSCICSILE